MFVTLNTRWPCFVVLLVKLLQEKRKVSITNNCELSAQRLLHPITYVSLISLCILLWAFVFHQMADQSVRRMYTTLLQATLDPLFSHFTPLFPYERP